MKQLLPYFQAFGVMFVGFIGAFLGRQVSKTRWHLWAIAYIIPLILMLAIAITRWIPKLEFTIPFRWIMASRMELVILAFLTTFTLTITVSRLAAKRLRILVDFLKWLIVFYCCLPFLMPALHYANHRGIKTLINKKGICIQSNDYTCGPAAAVTALRRLGVPAEEGELAILAHTTRIIGTEPDSLCSAISERYHADGIQCNYRSYRSISDLKQLPVIAMVKYSFLLNHYVTVLAVTDTTIEVGDPLEGKRVLSHGKFNEMWRNVGIVIEKVTTPK